MRVDIVFEFARIYFVDQRVDVALGQKFSLLTDSEVPVKFASINDAVLKLTESDSATEAEATAIGTSTILIMGPDFGILKQLVFNVVPSIEPAANLGITADQPVSK